MGKRLLHENICTSDKIDLLSAEEERLYVRLLTHLDDYGNFPADPKMIRTTCFPLKKKWNNPTIKFWLDRIVKVELASYYEVEGQKYVHFTRFENFQTLKYRNARYPLHPDGRGGHTSMMGGVIGDDGGGHGGMTEGVIGDEGGGQAAKPSPLQPDTNSKSLRSKKEARRSKPSPPVSKQEQAPAPSANPAISVREWAEDLDGTPAALIRRAIIYHLDHNPRDYHRSRISVAYVRKQFRAMIDDVPENWEPPKPKIRTQYDSACPKCRGTGGWTCKVSGGIGRTWQNCDCATEVSIAAA